MQNASKVSRESNPDQVQPPTNTLIWKILCRRTSVAVSDDVKTLKNCTEYVAYCLATSLEVHQWPSSSLTASQASVTDATAEKKRFSPKKWMQSSLCLSPKIGMTDTELRCFKCLSWTYVCWWCWLPTRRWTKMARIATNMLVLQEVPRRGCHQTRRKVFFPFHIFYYFNLS